MKCGKPNLKEWIRFVNKVRNPKGKVRIAVCGKYIELKDAYKSISEAFVHAGAENDVEVQLDWIRAEDVEDNGAEKYLKGAKGLLVPWGFGNRGIEGKIDAIRFAREHKIPFFGICLGFQCAVIEFARNVCGMKDANSTEFRKTKYNVIDMMLEQKASGISVARCASVRIHVLLPKRNKGVCCIQKRIGDGTTPSSV